MNIIITKYSQALKIYVTFDRKCFMSELYEEHVQNFNKNNNTKLIARFITFQPVVL